MPGIYGILSKTKQQNIPTISDQMKQMLMFKPWYRSTELHTEISSLGTISTAPVFNPNNVTAETDRFLVVVAGNAITIDGQLVEPDSTNLATRLINMYQDDGNIFIHRISGTFNIAFLDRNRQRLLIFNDRLGFQSLFHYHDADLFLFAPEMKAFLPYKRLDTSIDEAALALSLSTDVTHGNSTLLQNVKLLPPASCLEYGADGLKITRYWQPTFTPDLASSRQHFIDKGAELFAESVHNHVQVDPDQRVIFPLSGGLDSRLLLKLLAKQHNNIDIFTHGSSSCLDYRIAQKTAAALGLSDRHRLIEIQPD